MFKKKKNRIKSEKENMHLSRKENNTMKNIDCYVLLTDLVSTNIPGLRGYLVNIYRF